MSVVIGRAPIKGIAIGDRVWLDQNGMPWSEEEKQKVDGQPPFTRLLLCICFSGPYRYIGRRWLRHRYEEVTNETGLPQMS